MGNVFTEAWIRLKNQPQRHDLCRLADLLQRQSAVDSFVWQPGEQQFYTVFDSEKINVAWLVDLIETAGCPVHRIFQHNSPNAQVA